MPLTIAMPIGEPAVATEMTIWRLQTRRPQLRQVATLSVPHRPQGSDRTSVRVRTGYLKTASHHPHTYVPGLNSVVPERPHSGHSVGSVLGNAFSGALACSDLTSGDRAIVPVPSLPRLGAPRASRSSPTTPHRVGRPGEAGRAAGARDRRWSSRPRVASGRRIAPRFGLNVVFAR